MRVSGASARICSAASSPTETGHPVVEHADTGPGLEERGHGLGAVDGLGHDLDLGVVADGGPDEQSHVEVVVGDEHSYHVGLGHRHVVGAHQLGFWSPGCLPRRPCVTTLRGTLATGAVRAHPSSCAPPDRDRRVRGAAMAGERDARPVRPSPLADPSSPASQLVAARRHRRWWRPSWWSSVSRHATARTTSRCRGEGAQRGGGGFHRTAHGPAVVRSVGA